MMAMNDDDAIEMAEAVKGGGEKVSVLIDFAEGKGLNGEEEDEKMARAMADVVELRERLSVLGDCPDPNEVQEARQVVAAIDAALAKQLDSVLFAHPPSLQEGPSIDEWRASQDQKEVELREAAEQAKIPFQAIIELDDIYQIYEEKLKEAEAVLEGFSNESLPDSGMNEQADEDAAQALQEALEKGLDTLSLSGHLLPYISESFGKVSSLKTLDLSNNCLEVFPDSVAGLVNLLVLNLHANRLKVLPDSIGLLPNLSILNVSANRLKTIPESIMGCSALKELDAGFNEIEYLPTSFGLGLSSLEKLSLQLNKLITLPQSICEVKSLKHLDLHMNKLKELPNALGNLAKLQVLNASSNFRDLTFLPDSIGDLISLTDLDVSFNQLHHLPKSFRRLQNLRSLKLDENPLVDPPLDVIQQGLPAIMEYLSQEWRNSLVSSTANANQEEMTHNWLSWIPALQISEYLGNATRKWWWGSTGQSADDYLEQQF